mmetsp:Transcript_38016/g.73639  ORF Transcript_38016/g.73639 Transcript_38016/m.73639 type:complete len:410 (+) Transcript_38016:62-1291(+)
MIKRLKTELNNLWWLRLYPRIKMSWNKLWWLRHAVYITLAGTVAANLILYSISPRKKSFPMVEAWPEGWILVNRSRVVVGGHSNAADFAHQVHIAYSSMVNGACIFAGQPFHCAVTRFEPDPLLDTGFFEDISHNVPSCDGCPRGKTLVYDHCKNLPHVVDAGMLPDYPRRHCGPDGAPGCLDSTEHLRKPSQRVYLQRGANDKCYRKGSVANTQSLYFQLMDDPRTQVVFNNTLPYKHEIPIYEEYDGPKECFKHTISNGMELNPKMVSTKEANIYRFKQDKFDGYDTWVGTNEWGWLYVPKTCTNESDSKQPCSLFVYFRPCGGGSGETDSHFDSFDRWAEKNRIVILVPVIGKNLCYLKYNGCHEVARGCWDGYGQLGKDYALQSGKHMKFVGSMLKDFLATYGVD